MQHVWRNSVKNDSVIVLAMKNLLEISHENFFLYHIKLWHQDKKNVTHTYNSHPFLNIIHGKFHFT